MSDQEVWFIKKEAASRNPEKSWGPSPVKRRNQRCVTAICPGPDANDMNSLANPAQWMFRMGTGPSNPTEILKWRTIRCYQRCFCSGGSASLKNTSPRMQKVKQTGTCVCGILGSPHYPFALTFNRSHNQRMLLGFHYSHMTLQVLSITCTTAYTSNFSSLLGCVVPSELSKFQHTKLLIYIFWRKLRKYYNFFDTDIFKKQMTFSLYFK